MLDIVYSTWLNAKFYCLLFKSIRLGSNRQLGYLQMSLIISSILSISLGQFFNNLTLVIVQPNCKSRPFWNLHECPMYSMRMIHSSCWNQNIFQAYVNSTNCLVYSSLAVLLPASLHFTLHTCGLVFSISLQIFRTFSLHTSLLSVTPLCKFQLVQPL